MFNCWNDSKLKSIGPIRTDLRVKLLKEHWTFKSVIGEFLFPFVALIHVPIYLSEEGKRTYFRYAFINFCSTSPIFLGAQTFQPIISHLYLIDESFKHFSWQINEKCMTFLRDYGNCTPCSLTPSQYAILHHD